VDGAVVELAARVIGGAPSSLQRYGIADEQAWEVGLPCGGEIDVWIEPYEPGGLQAAFFEQRRADRRAVLITALAGPRPGAKLLLAADAPARGTLGSERLDAVATELGREALQSEAVGSIALPELDARLFVDVTAPRPCLVMVGATDIARHLSRLSRALGWRPFVVDPRTRYLDAERFPDAERLIAAWPQEGLTELAPLDRGAAVAILTHDPKLDDAALLAALRSGAGYVGAIGSRRTQADRRARLRRHGLAPEDLDRICGPIGLDIGARGPAETALAIMAEVVAHRHHRPGGRLVEATGPIHSRL
jgi:xanthine dehydrogenase accessory factor